MYTSMMQEYQNALNQIEVILAKKGVTALTADDKKKLQDAIRVIESHKQQRQNQSHVAQ